MTSAFFGLDMALRALQAQQTGMDVTGHNVANANTEGYSRQNVRITATDPFTMPAMNRSTTAGQLGTGAIAKNIQRARDVFLDAQYRTEDGSLKNAEARRDALEQVETVLDEPQGTGISSQLNDFYTNWNQLANDPSDLPTRTALVQQAASLAQSFNRISGQLTDIQQGLDGEVKTDVSEVNTLTDNIVKLNQTIVQIELSGQAANDLRDQRDVALDRLSELVQISTSENADGSVNVNLGSQKLIDATSGTSVKTDLVAVPNPGNSNFNDVTFGAGGPAANLGNAEIAGKIKVRDTEIGATGTGYLAQLNTIANNLISAVNYLHNGTTNPSGAYDANGNPGGDFFTGSGAASITVNAAIVADPKLLAAAAGAAPPATGSAGPGSNGVVMQIAGLRDSMAAAIPPLAAGTPTAQSSYNALIADLGMTNRTARSDASVQGALVTLLETRRQSVSGVSLDEEATNMVRYQRAYEAAARLMTANDEMLDKLINSTGVVGR